MCVQRARVHTHTLDIHTRYKLDTIQYIQVYIRRELVYIYINQKTGGLADLATETVDEADDRGRVLVFFCQVRETLD